MQTSFNYYEQVESPNMYLCNPNQKILGTIVGEDRNVTLRFNDLSELTFTVHKGVCSDDIYKKIETRRLVFVEQIGWFQIIDVTDTIDGDSESKSVTCESHQTQLKSRGFISEERVYMFYNPYDELDDNYDSTNIAAIPSVIGQLNKQLGIKVQLNQKNEVTEKDYEDWTIVYIGDSLKFKAESYDKMYVALDGADNVCRSFSSSTSFGYDFIINDVEKAFEVVFEFDYLHHAIKIDKLENITEKTNIYLSLDNLVETISVSEKAENIVTVLSCNGGDIDIRMVNPMGTNYIANFGYYKKKENGRYPWMSKELIEALNDWSKLCNEKDSEYTAVINDLQKAYEQKAVKEKAITEAKLKAEELRIASNQYKDEGFTATDGLVVLETVNSGSSSLWEFSAYRDKKHFSEDSIITAYKKVEVKKGNSDNDYIIETSESTMTGKAKLMIGGFIDSGKQEDDGTLEPAEESECYLYFFDGTVDGNGADTGKRVNYCKLQISSEMEVVKSTDGVIGLNGSATVREHTFNVETGSDSFVVTTDDGNTFSVSKPEGRFTYKDTVFKIKKTSDDVIAIYCFYVSGFKRYAPLDSLVGDDANNNWVTIWDKRTSFLKRQTESFLEPLIERYNGQIKKITEACNIEKFVKEKGEHLYRELQSYWIEGEYTNDNISASEDTTTAERIKLAKELIKAGQKELEKVSQPTFELSVSAINFLKLIQYRDFSDELKLGCVITVERDDNTHYRPALTSIEYDLDDGDTFSLTFSTAGKLDETAMTFADLLNETSSTSRTVSANWSNLTDYSKNKQTITDLLSEPLNRTLRLALGNEYEQDFIIDETGILGRKWSDDSHSGVDSQQLRIANNVIMFTDDAWKTIRTALGKVCYTYYNENGEPIEGTGYGLAAEVLIGNLMLTSKMNIINENRSIQLDENGIIIKNGESTAFKADIEGNLFLRGTIESDSGKIGGFTIGEGALYNGLDSMSSNETGVYIGIDGIKLGNSFLADNTGKVEIKAGEINLLQESGNEKRYAVFNESGIWYKYIKQTGNSKADISRKFMWLGFDNAYTVGLFGEPQVAMVAYPEGTVQTDKEGNVTSINYLADGEMAAISMKGGDESHIQLTASTIVTLGLFNGGSCPATLADSQYIDNVEPLADISTYDSLLANLKPVRYKYKDGTSGRYHTGFVAQNLLDAITSSGLTEKDFAGYISGYNESVGAAASSIRYEEIIALCVNSIQQIKKQIRNIGEEIKELKGE